MLSQSDVDCNWRQHPASQSESRARRRAGRAKPSFEGQLERACEREGEDELGTKPTWQRTGKDGEMAMPAAGKELGKKQDGTRENALVARMMCTPPQMRASL